MWVSVLLLQQTYATLTITSPSELIDDLATSSPSYQILLHGAVPYNSAIEYSLKTPSTKSGCSPHSETFSADTALLLYKGECDFATKLGHAQDAQAGGIILINSSNENVTDNRYDVPYYRATSSYSIFGIIINLTDGITLLKYSNIKVQFSLTLRSSSTPEIAIGLTGINYLDFPIVQQAFRYLSGSSYSLKVYFNFLDCSSCTQETMSKYCIGTLCMVDPQGIIDGNELVKSSITHYCALQINSSNLEFLVYMLKVTNNCKLKYTECIRWAYLSVYSSEIDLNTCVNGVMTDMRYHNLQAPSYLPVPGI